MMQPRSSRSEIGSNGGTGSATTTASRTPLTLPTRTGRNARPNVVDMPPTPRTAGSFSGTII
eukprot:8207570-Lingulodinium_polyedra.AAC.1